MRYRSKLLFALVISTVLVIGGFFVLSAVPTKQSSTRPVVLPSSSSTAVQSIPSFTETQTASSTSVVTSSPTLVHETDAFGAYDMWKHIGSDAKENSVKDYSKNFPTGTLRVAWLDTHESVPTSTFIAMMDNFFPGYSNPSTCDAKYTSEQTNFCDLEHTTVNIAGTILQPQSLKGTALYNISFPHKTGEEDLFSSDVHFLAFFDKKTTKIIYFAESDNTDTDPLSNAMSSDQADMYLNHGIIGGVITYIFPELNPPASLSIPGTSSTLLKTPWTFRDEPGPKKFSLVDSKTIVFTDPVYGPIYFYGQSYVLAFPNGARRYYHLKPYFLNDVTPPPAAKAMFADSYRADIVWTDGRTDADNSFIPSVEGRGGCGGSMFPLAGDVTRESWFHKENLVKVGETKLGESIYELKNPSKNPIYKQVFDQGYESAYEESHPSTTADNYSRIPESVRFQEFLSEHPIFFWQDPFHHWVMFQKSKYRSLAECGKPVIYLYPPKTTDVHVEVKPNGGFTRTDPVYGKNGWFVRAEPNGVLFNYATATSYPYLFWEGHATGPDRPEEGFVWKKLEVHNRLTTTLTQLGLNDREVSDFVEFWLPKMTVKPYVFVTFVPQAIFNRMAPLTLSPKPDSVIRVFMNFEPLDAPQVVQPLSIITPKRHGFAVVEWGGVLREGH